MAKKVWKEWVLRTSNSGYIQRYPNGKVALLLPHGQNYLTMTPTDARRLFQKLSGDYKD